MFFRGRRIFKRFLLRMQCLLEGASFGGIAVYIFLYLYIFFQRLLPVEMANELPPAANVSSPSPVIYTIRPYMETDKVGYLSHFIFIFLNFGVY